jgi:hypothetical protein
MTLAYFVLGVIAYQIIKALVLIARKEIREYRDRRFLRQVRINFPDAKDITLTSVSTSDKKALANIERQLREHR